LRIVESADPQAANAIRRRFLQRSFEAARPAVSSAPTAGVKFSAARFLNSLPDEPTMEAIGYNATDRAQIRALASVLERVSVKAFEGSPTTPMAIAWDMAKGVFSLNPVQMIRSAGTIITPKAIARIALTEEGRKNLIIAATQPKKSMKAAQAIAYLTGRLSQEDLSGEFEQNVRPVNAQ